MEILNTVYKCVISDGTFIILGIMLFISMVLFVIGFSGTYDALFIASGLSMFIIFFTMIGLNIYNVNHKSDKVKYYEVTISDDVKLSEFNKKYEIIDQRGKIYKVRERK